MQEALTRIEAERGKENAQELCALRESFQLQIQNLKKDYESQIQDVQQHERSAVAREQKAWEDCRYKPLHEELEAQKRACVVLREANNALVDRCSEERVSREGAEAVRHKCERETKDVRLMCERAKAEADSIREEMKLERDASERHLRELQVHFPLLQNARV